MDKQADEEVRSVERAPGDEVKKENDRCPPKSDMLSYTHIRVNSR